MLGVTLLLLMIELQSFSRVALVFLTFPMGPMAITIMGGLLVANALTLLAVPAAYAAWFKVRAQTLPNPPPNPPPGSPPQTAAAAA